MRTEHYDEPKGRRQIGFTTTHWSVVIEASTASAERRNAAIEKLFRTYWHPLYFYVRRRGQDHHQAEDLLQGFFLALIEKNYLSAVAPAKGKFRSFLAIAIKRYMAKEWARENTIKRGGRAPHMPLDFDLAQRLYDSQDPAAATPEILFDRSWSVTVLNRALAELESRIRKGDCDPHFDFLRTTLPGFERTLSYEEAARQLNRPINTIKSDVNRFRHRFIQVVRELVAETVCDPAEVNDELRYLIRILG